MTTAVAEPMLAPDSAAIRKLREKRKWTLDDAVFHARQAGLRLSRQTLVDLESGKQGCRLATIGVILRLYREATFDSVTREVPEPTAKPRGARSA